MADGGDPLKKKLLGWMQNTLNKVTEVIDEEQARTAPPPPAAPPPKPEPKRAVQTGQLARPGSDTFARTGPIPPVGGANRPGTDVFARASAPLAPLPGQAPSTGALKSPEEEAAESKKRMGFIVAYMKDPASDPAFTDKPLVYRILTEERTYQQKLVTQLDGELAGLLAKQATEPPDAERDALLEDLQSRIDAAKTRQGQLFVLMKKLTGVRGKTGGTGFLSPQGSNELPPLPGPPPL